ncbi:unnamed protein product [Owenia fusiformis]|uniref:Uncharacterized protein n=1 Tax=Owenia fusiformis TaxID=6347 RepID=A0A8J1U3T2_OWEFU|nr:unnamed protein product [Owenia fusiformis]
MIRARYRYTNLGTIFVTTWAVIYFFFILLWINFIPNKEDETEASIKETLKNMDSMVHEHEDTEVKQMQLRFFGDNGDKLEHTTTTEPFQDLDELSQNINMGELSKFQDLVSWAGMEPKAVIYIIYSRLQKMRMLLESLQANFLTNFRYPIVVFYEKKKMGDIPHIRSFLDSQYRIFFQIVKFETPSFITKEIVINPMCNYPVSYRHMLRFQSKTVYQQPILKGMEYYWRLDDDSEVAAPIKFDIFKYMKENKLQYGYQIQTYDNGYCSGTFSEAIKKYKRMNHITPSFELETLRIYFTNFEVASFEFWHSKNYTNFIEYIDQLGGIYYERWSDAAIKSQALSMFMPENKIHQFIDVPYRHVNYENYGVDSDGNALD